MVSTWSVYKMLLNSPMPVGEKLEKFERQFSRQPLYLITYFYKNGLILITGNGQKPRKDYLFHSQFSVEASRQLLAVSLCYGKSLGYLINNGIGLVSVAIRETELQPNRMLVTDRQGTPVHEITLPREQA